MNENIFQIARQQVDLVKSVLGKRFAFEDNSTNEVQSGYTTYGTLETPTALIVVRLSNHICSMNNWTTRYKPKLIANSKLARRMGNNLQLPYKERCFFSIVFKAFDYTPNDVGNWKAICREYVFNPLEIEKSGTIGNISKDCLKLNSNEIISINGQNPIDRIAKKANTTENNQINENRNMNKKQVIRINENQLRQIVKESVNKIVNEIKQLHQEPDNYNPFATGNERKQQMASIYRKDEKSIKQWNDMLNNLYKAIDCIDDTQGNYYGNGAIDIANKYGGQKSYKRVLLAKDYLQKAAKLISAARQDIFVLGKYNEDYHNEVDMDNVIPYSKDTEEFYNGVY